MSCWSASSTRDEARAWLERARVAVERRNAALHATPLVRVEPGRRDGPERLLLGEMPRHGRPYVERQLTVDSLAELRSVLVAAVEGWRDLVIAVSAERKRQDASSEPQPPAWLSAGLVGGTALGCLGQSVGLSRGLIRQRSRVFGGGLLRLSSLFRDGYGLARMDNHSPENRKVGGPLR